MRNGWHQAPGEDIIVSALLGAEPSRGRGLSVNGSVWLLAANQRYEFPGLFLISSPSAIDLDSDRRQARIVARARSEFGIGSRPVSWIEWFSHKDSVLLIDLDDRLDDGLRAVIAMRGPGAGFVAVDARGSSTYGGHGLGWGNVLSIHDPLATEPFKPAQKLPTGLTKLDAPQGIRSWAINHPLGVVYLCVVDSNTSTANEPQLNDDGILIGQRQFSLLKQCLNLTHPNAPPSTK